MALIQRNESTFSVFFFPTPQLHTMKHLALLLVLLAPLLGARAMAQTDPPKLQIAVETDLIAYTSLGGYSAWATVQHHRNRLSISYVNYPNRRRGIYNDTGIQEDDRFLRLSLWRYWNDQHTWMYGLNGEYHWRRLVEDGNASEELNDSYVSLGFIVGYHWHPFNERENALQNLSFSAWAGVNYLFPSTVKARVFEQTGSVYNSLAPFGPTIGVNVSYTLFQK